MIKNGIEIIGLSPQEEFSSISSPYSVPFSQRDYISVNRKKHHIKELLKVSFDIVNLTYNEILLKDKKILAFEGIKNYTLEYRDTHKKRITVIRTIPFNHFIELPTTVDDFDDFKILKMDGTFKNINGNLIYGNILLLIALISKKESLILDSNELKPDYDIVSIDDDINDTNNENIDVEKLYSLKEDDIDLIVDEKGDMDILITENNNELHQIENKEEDIEYIPEQPIVENIDVEKLYSLKEDDVNLIVDEKGDMDILITENNNGLHQIENKEEDIEYIPEQPIVENNIVELDEEFM